MSHKTDRPKQELKIKQQLVVAANKNFELIEFIKTFMAAVEKKLGVEEYKKFLNSIGLEAK